MGIHARDKANEMVLKRSERCYSLEHLARKTANGPSQRDFDFDRERTVNYNRRQKFVLVQRRASIDLSVTAKPRGPTIFATLLKRVNQLVHKEKEPDKRERSRSSSCSSSFESINHKLTRQLLH